MKLYISQRSEIFHSVGRASHRYRGGHGFESRWSPAIFQASSFQLLKLENLLRWSLFTFNNSFLVHIGYEYKIWVETTADAITVFNHFNCVLCYLWKKECNKNLTDLELVIPKRKQLKNYVTSRMTTNSPNASAAPATTWGQWTNQKLRLVKVSRAKRR